MTLTVAEIVDFLRKIAPLDLAEEWDNVGLLLGDTAGPAQRIMTCLTVTPACVQEAVDSGVSLIVTHHPILFRGCTRLTASDADGKTLLPLIRAGVAVYSPHTAFDNAQGGINDLIAGWLELRQVRSLRSREQPGSASAFKIVVFVPDKDLHKVADAMFAAGAGQIGQYSQCSFRIPGTGTFFGSDETNPTLGQKGRREEVSELRLEVVCPAEALGAVVTALRKAHSYEEPAYDIYPLQKNPVPSPGTVGAGRTGQLAEPTPLRKLAEHAQKALRARQVQIVGDPARMVQRVAIVCGAGGDFMADAVSEKADVLLTGEARFHECLAAESGGLALLLPGHYASERPGVETLADTIQRRFGEAKVWASQRESDPLTFV